MIEAKVTLTQPLSNKRQFVARTGSGHHLLIDDKDGASGPKPIELVAAGLAGCTAFDVISILRKKRMYVTDYEVQVEADQAPQPPAVFERVRLHHVVSGVDIDRKAVEDAIRLSEEKYCSVGAMIRKTAEFDTTFELREVEVEDDSPKVIDGAVR
ncbi:MAG TPA: OsmC family protein [Terriglobales bacterium]|nr:OsmC family protein [Terriglobales bacterium]